ncbi:MAG: bifunctional riboflavin kinase/FAD synthetase [Deltaproteobacteria bacterium]|nr:bifunctional riboflavin kinase/FAD synthetase [Deltaproteobacteria bacterium]
MLVARSIDEFRNLTPPDAVVAATIGNFDGVHRGHRELIRVTREKAAARGMALGRKVPAVLVTFDPHPVHVVRGIARPDLLTPLPRKLELLERAGLDAVLVLPFTREMAETPAELFVREILVETLHATDLVVGFNFALGKGRAGNYTALRALGESLGFSVTQVQPVVVGKETVSSSLIREHIRSGNVENVVPLLCRMHSVDGEIIHGQARGRTLGFPTANIDYGNVLLPPLGAYATWLQILADGPKAPPLQSMTSVGTNPTFGGGVITLETNVLDFSGDLYGKTVRLHFASRLRAEITFKSVDDLVARLRGDAEAARAALRRTPGEPLH